MHSQLPQRPAHRQIRALHKPDDLVLLGRGQSHVTFPPTVALFAKAGQAVVSHDEFAFENTSRSQHLRGGGVDETDADLARALGEIKPAFLAQFHGSILRGKDRGPDWCTQVSASLRKLLLGVLHTAAPDDLVLPWGDESQAAA